MKTDEIAASGKQFWLIYSALIVLVLIRIIPFFYPGSRTWGFNHLIFLPKGFSIAFFVVATIALLLPFVNRFEKWGGWLTDQFCRVFFESPRFQYYRAVFAISMGLLFMLFTVPTHFLGDGYSLIRIIADKSSHAVRWSSGGVFSLLYGILELLDSQNAESSLFLYQATAIISGFFTIFFYFGIAQFLSEKKAKRLLIFAVSLLSGSILLFFGYVENYSILWPIFAAYFYFGLKYIKTGSGLVTLLILFVAGSILHLLIFLLLPSTIFLFLSTAKWKDFFHRHRNGVIVVAILGSVAALVLAVNIYLNNLGLQVMHLDIFVDKFPGRNYLLFSVAHILDIINLLILLSPLIFILPFMISSGAIRSTPKKLSLFLVIAGISYLLFLLLIDPKLGLPRDWDLFSLTYYPWIILFVQFLGDSFLSAIRRVSFSLIALLLIFCLPFLLVNLNEGRSVRYAEYMANLDFDISRKLVYLLSEYHYKRGDFKADDSLQKIMRNDYPFRNRYQLINKALDNNELEKAERLLNVVKPSLYDSEYQRLKGRLQFYEGKYDSALIHYDNAIQLREFLVANYAERADVYFALKNKEKGFDDLRYGYQLDNNNIQVLNLLIIAFSEFGPIDSSLYYCDKLNSIDETAWIVYYELARVHAGRNDPVGARKYAERMARLKLSDKDYLIKLNEMSALLEGYDNSDKNLPVNPGGN